MTVHFLPPSHFLCGHRLLTLPDTEEDSRLKSRPKINNKTSEIQPENNASFLKTMAKRIRNRSQGTTFIAEEQKHIGGASGSR